MKLNAKKKKNEKDKTINKEENGIEIVYGNGSEFQLDTKVGDYMNDLKPVTDKKNKKRIVIPKTTQELKKKKKN